MSKKKERTSIAMAGVSSIGGSPKRKKATLKGKAARRPARKGSRVPSTCAVARRRR